MTYSNPNHGNTTNPMSSVDQAVRGYGEKREILGRLLDYRECCSNSGGGDVVYAAGSYESRHCLRFTFMGPAILPAQIIVCINTSTPYVPSPLLFNGWPMIQALPGILSRANAKTGSEPVTIPTWLDFQRLFPSGSGTSEFTSQTEWKNNRHFHDQEPVHWLE